MKKKARDVRAYCGSAAIGPSNAPPFLGMAPPMDLGDPCSAYLAILLPDDISHGERMHWLSWTARADIFFYIQPSAEDRTFLTAAATPTRRYVKSIRCCYEAFCLPYSGNTGVSKKPRGSPFKKPVPTI